MSPKTRQVVRAIALATGVALPTLSLVPLGGIWLFEQGYVLPWALIMLAVVGLTTFLEWRWLGGRTGRTVFATDDPSPAPSSGSQSEVEWSSDEQRAWGEVVRIAHEIDPGRLASRDDVLVLGVDTIRAVARELHTGRRDPHLQFTLPEALAIVEQVSRHLGTFVVENIPLGDRMTVAHAMTLYRWRGAISVAERAFDLWRVVRMVNPMTAATHELRERLTRQLYQWGRDHVIRRLSEAYVLEIGRAAIDLYGGRMASRVRSSDSTQSAPTEAPSPDEPRPDQGGAHREGGSQDPAVTSRWAKLWAQSRGAGRTIVDTLVRRKRR